MTTGRLLRSKKTTTEFVDFTHASPANTIIRIMPKGRRLAEVRIIVDEVFDDPTAVASVGTTLDNEQFMKEVENDITKVTEHAVRPGFIDESNNTTVRIFLNAGASTQGKATVYIDYI